MKKINFNFRKRVKKYKLVFFGFAAIAAAAVWMTGCGNLYGPNDTEGDSTEERRTLSTYRLFEVTITGIGTDKMSAGIQSTGPKAAYNLTRPSGSAGAEDGTIQAKVVSHGSFVYGTRGSGGKRYIWATYKVRNANSAGDPYTADLNNLTFLAVNTAETYGQTAVSFLQLFNGVELTGTDAVNLAKKIIPTGRVAVNDENKLHILYPDALQIFKESEVQGLPVPSKVVDVFPYGFVTHSPSVTPNSRRLPNLTGDSRPVEDQYDGLVTFAFSIPLQTNAYEDPFQIRIMLLAYEDDEVRLTQPILGQNQKDEIVLQNRVNELGASLVTIFPGSRYSWNSSGNSRILCGPIRIAGPPGNPTALLFEPMMVFLSPNPYSSGANSIPSTTAFSATFSKPIGNYTLVNSSTFAVKGSQSGLQFKGQTYKSEAVKTITTPSANLFPGETVTVTLTPRLGICPGQVYRYQVAAGGPGNGGYSAASTYSVGNDPSKGIIAGDFDSDGDLDLAVANSQSDSISVLENNGDGTFKPASMYSVGNGPIGITAGDFNADGHSDLAVANEQSDNVSVLISNGDGTFATLTSEYNVGDRPGVITAGDFDADGDLDLAVANSAGGTISILENNGDGTFVVPAPSFAVGSFFFSGLAAGDFDNDGDLDLAVTVGYFENHVYVLKNNGDGSFGGAVAYSPGYSPEGITTGDFNSDGDLDLAVANSRGGTISILINNGDGTFVTPTPKYNVGASPMDITRGDFNGDGDLDLAVTNPGEGTISVLINNGDGTFVTPALKYDGGISPMGITTGDFNGDGDIDLAVSITDNKKDTVDKVSVLENQ